MREPKRRLTIKEWELETGIKVLDPKGFTNWNGRARIKTNKYTKEQFRRGIEKSIITVKNQKGLDFLSGVSEDNEQWRSYIKINARRNKNYDNSRTR